VTARPVGSHAELFAALPGDLLLRQLAVHWAVDEPAYACDGAVSLFHLWGDTPEAVVVGDPAAAEVLARDLLVTGRAVSLPERAADRLLAEPGLVAHGSWAFRWTDAAPAVPASGAAWLPDTAAGEVGALLAEAFPDASMPVGHPDVRRWAGLRRDGRLVAVAADATQAEGLGFLASIATRHDARGKGAGTAVTAFATAALVAEQGRCGLWHMSGNPAAVAVYDRLGYRDDHRMAVVGPAS
jgi:ribosomal protein S18 acetylase RimI-like enzyme